MRHPIIAFFLGLSVTACAEAATTAAQGGNGGDGGAGDGGATTASGGSDTSSGGVGGSAGTSSGGAAVGPVVVNEIKGSDGDYVELMNTGADAFDLSDHAIADALDDGAPKLDGAARFPEGTKLEPFEHLLLLADQDPAEGVGPHDICLPDGGPSTCYYSTWGISDGNGDKIFLLSPDDEVVAEAEYPAGAVPAGSSWGRLPDGTGDFTENAPTPGEPNNVP
jgi:hypothetical protein